MNEFANDRCYWGCTICDRNQVWPVPEHPVPKPGKPSAFDRLVIHPSRLEGR